MGLGGRVAERASAPAVRSIALITRGGPSGAVERTVAETIEGLGHGCEAPRDGTATLDPAGLVLLRGSPNWYPQTWHALAAAPPAERPRSMLWVSEPLPMPRAAALPSERLTARELAKIVLRDRRRQDPISNARAIRELAAQGLPDRIVTTSEGAAELLAEQGIEAGVAPYGYHETHGRDLGLVRDVDVLFLGEPRLPRRRRALARLARAGIRVRVAGGWGAGGMWGDERTELVNRARLLVNVQRYPGQFSGERLLIGIANGAVVVSEPIYRPAPFVPGTHYVEAPLSALPDTIERLLADDGERARIAAAGRELLSGLTMERSVARVLELAG